jgi:glycosyltransferase involved in cell wall biosynthesis
MRILLALPKEHPPVESIDAVLAGRAACSGTIGAIIRAAEILGRLGHEVWISGSRPLSSKVYMSVTHDSVVPALFDRLVVHQSHWDGGCFSFGESCIKTTVLWLQNQIPWKPVDDFIKAGGFYVICPSLHHSNLYRAVGRFRQRIGVVYNSYSSSFKEELTESPTPGRLLFIGAVTPSKGFRELMTVWRGLANSGSTATLAIAGSIEIHSALDCKGPIGIADPSFEVEEIVPWRESLPMESRPTFLGSLSPNDLRREIACAQAVLVNPSWNSFETFCVAAVEAQACGRPVFSVARGGLMETVYSGEMATLSSTRQPLDLARMIELWLTTPEKLRDTGKAARQFVLRKFSDEVISDQWNAVLTNRQSSLKPTRRGSGSRDVICNVLRMTGSGRLFERVALGRR